MKRVGKGRARIFRRDPDYEASSIVVEADSITQNELIRKSNDHRGSQIDADGNAKIVVVSQYANKGSKKSRPDAKTVIEGDLFTINAREINVHKKSGKGSRTKASARNGVGIFRRRFKGEGRK